MLGPYTHRIDPILFDVGGVHLWWYGLRPVRRGQDLDHEIGRYLQESVPTHAEGVAFVRQEQDVGRADGVGVPGGEKPPPRRPSRLPDSAYARSG